MAGDLSVAMEDMHRLAPTLYLDPLADQAEGHRVAVGVQTDQIVLGHDARARASCWKLRCPANGNSCPRSRSNRTMGRSWVVPCTARQRSRVPCIELGLEVLQITNVRPGRKLRFTYLTPDSTLPLVCARYGRHTRGSKPQ